MTPQQTLRRQDQPIQIGPRHGYRIEGDHAFINAELQIPPYHSGGDWTLELWASEQPYRGEGPMTGVKVAQLALELPTPIGPYVHQVDTRTAARLPLQGRPYAMALALVQPGPDGATSVHASANYPEPQIFSAPHFEGNVGYAVRGAEVVLEADGIFNPRSSANLSGTLSLELWAFPEAGSSTEGLRLAASEIAPVAGQSEVTAIERRVAFSEPPVGRFQLALLLCEWTFANGYVERDRRDFRCIYERSTSQLAGSAPAPAPVSVTEAAAVAARPVDRLRLVPTIEPEVAPVKAEAPAQPSVAPVKAEAPAAPGVAPVKVEAPAQPAVAAVKAEAATQPVVAAVKAEAATPGARALVSVQTGSLEELAAVKGLSFKIAKEIIKARPFSSLADLIRVRGLGQKTIDRIKHLVRL